ncbi:uncharacterized protein ACNLHF_003364 isoform 2-T2 [Anomaloglossus baeobatrachus]
MVSPVLQASPPQLPGVVLLVLGLCCAAVICQLKSRHMGKKKEEPYEINHIRRVLEFCNEIFHDCPLLGENSIPWKQKNVYYFMDIYLYFARKEGNPETMNGKEFTYYLIADIPGYIEDLVKNAMTQWDEDKDGELSMSEYFTFIQIYMIEKFGNNRG